ncbi:MAG: C25 family cysteine peptidase, partial [Candidatus Eiseniibacteriota bacterium]
MSPARAFASTDHDRPGRAGTLLPAMLLIVVALTATMVARPATASPATPLPTAVAIELEFPRSSLVTSQHGGGVATVELPGCESTARIGAPALPARGEQIVLPAGTRARSVYAVSLESVRIATAPVRPAVPPAILGPIGVDVPAPPPVAPDPDVYEGWVPYPLELAVLARTGRFLGDPVASCIVHPVQYDPTTRELVLHTRLALIVELEPDPAPAGVDAATTGGDMARLGTRLAGGVLRRAPAGMQAGGVQAGRAVALDPGRYAYVIVTEESQTGPYTTWAAWKTAKGIPATVVTVEWIDTTYPGRDLPEKIRNFVIEATQTWGTSYVLLGGDQPNVPSRVSWAFDCEAGFYPDENDLYADLYYSDLDGTWDANQNNVFGEVDDAVDLYPDVLVGRAPSGDAVQASAMVNKFLVYEKTPPSGRMMEAFYFAEVLWQDPFTDAGIGKDMIAERHFAAYEPIERQYETMGNLSPSSVINYLNWGPHLTNHGGHANFTVMGCGTGFLDRGDASALTNAPYFFVHYSIGCWAAAFDRDCIAEHFMTNPAGGTIAFIGNSRYGWGSPGNPGRGYSETFDSDFYGAILSEGITQFGAAVARAKLLRIPFSHDANVYRWHQYQVNLLGDPEMACHTAPITAMVLSAPEAVPIGTGGFTATVNDAGGPVGGARLCLAGPDVYLVGLADDEGRVIFDYDIPAAQSLTLTASAPNHMAVEQPITAAGQDPFLTVAAWTVDDDAVPPSAGNDDGEIGRGEVIELLVTIHNHGAQDCVGVSGTLAETCEHVEVLEQGALFGTVPAGGEASAATPFVFQVAHGCPVDLTVPFTLDLADGSGGSWSAPLPLRVVAPGPRFHHYDVAELVGNGDGVVDPGETVALTVHVLNEGSGDIGAATATLTSMTGDVAVDQGTATLAGPVAPGAIGVLEPAFEVTVSGGCPATTYRGLDLVLVHDEGTDEDGFLLAIGEAGFEDDMESGQGGWTHSGTHDLWHLTDYRRHSG